MNSVQRVFAALDLEQPDRVPTFDFVIDHKVIEAICPGSSYHDFVERFDLDAVVTLPDYTRVEIDTDVYRDEWGVVKKVTGEETACPIATVIKCEKDIQSYTPPDPLADHRLVSLKKAVARFKGKKAIVINLHDVFSIPRYLRGYSEILMDFVLNPRIVRALVDLSVDYNIELARRASAIGAEIVVTSDDIASNHGLVMSPAHFREFLLPGMKRVFKAFREAGLYVIKHTDGNITPILDMLIDAGIDAINPIDPVAGMDIGEVKKRYSNKVCLMGNVDCAGVLVYGSQQEVVEAVKDCIKRASPGGGHIISSSNSIHSGVKPENYSTMLEAIQQYGGYPISI